MKTNPKSRDCPCHSGARYSACCEIFHSGKTEAPTPEALMRSRYAAFALGLGDYLWKTLANEHPDRDRPRDAFVRELSRIREKQRFMGLRILEASSNGDRGEVVFHARIFERGQDRSFTEHSVFTREDGAWRYLRPEPIDAAKGDAAKGDATGSMPGEPPTE